jgi:cobalamin-dependent methionine synthase I
MEDARKNAFIWNEKEAKIHQPNKLGINTLTNIELEEIIPYIDGASFFTPGE